VTQLPDIADVQARADRVLADELYWFPVRHHSPAAARHVRAAIRAEAQARADRRSGARD